MSIEHQTKDCPDSTTEVLEAVPSRSNLARDKLPRHMLGRVYRPAYEVSWTVIICRIDLKMLFSSSSMVALSFLRIWPS